MSQEYTSLDFVARSSGFFCAGWVAWRRRSLTSSWACRTRYMVDTEAR